ncbi:RNA polymerase II transcription factor B subunit 3 [Melampsora americana]|nr:RNA polymerase II transcription factor B subunit 3 [Melampsora americana]
MGSRKPVNTKANHHHHHHLINQSHLNEHSNRGSSSSSNHLDPNSLIGSSSNKSVVGPSNLKRDQSGRTVEFFSETDVCPICKSDRYLNPDLRLLVSKCYHKMCESCIDRIFSLGPEPCPICGLILRKSNFSPQTFENLKVEKEILIRKRIHKLFNKRLEDFKSLDHFNNYLEEVEEITFNLINGVDVLETEAKIKKYQIENEDLIAQNAVHEARQVELNKRQEEAIKREREERKAELIRLEEEALREERELKQETIRNLADSDVSAEKLIARQRALAQKKSVARALASDLATKSTLTMPSLTGLLDSSVSQLDDEQKPDIEGELGRWNDYSNLFELQTFQDAYRPGYVDEESIGMVLSDDRLAFVGGFELESVWERQIRSAVMGLFVIRPEEGSTNPLLSDQIITLDLPIT